MNDELAKTIADGRSRLELSLEHTARHLAGSAFANFAAGLHSSGVVFGGVSGRSHAAALCSMAATVHEAAQGFVDGVSPEACREAAQLVHAALIKRLGTKNAIGQLRAIGEGIKWELAGAEAARIADVGLLRHMMRATYGNVEALLSALNKQS